LLVGSGIFCDIFFFFFVLCILPLGLQELHGPGNIIRAVLLVPPPTQVDTVKPHIRRRQDIQPEEVPHSNAPQHQEPVVWVQGDPSVLNLPNLRKRQAIVKYARCYRTPAVEQGFTCCPVKHHDALRATVLGHLGTRSHKSWKPNSDNVGTERAQAFWGRVDDGEHNSDISFLAPNKRTEFFGKGRLRN
jgi:hypothetical protein